jgi:hypothetical protein
MAHRPWLRQASQRPLPNRLACGPARRGPEAAGRLHDDPRMIYLHLKAPRFDLHRPTRVLSRVRRAAGPEALLASHDAMPTARARAPAAANGTTQSTAGPARGW